MESAVDETGRLRGAGDRGEAALGQQRVGVQEQEHVAAGGGGAGIHLCRAAARRRVHPHDRIAREDRARVVDAAAVDRDDLGVAVRRDFGEQRSSVAGSAAASSTTGMIDRDHHFLWAACRSGSSRSRSTRP